MLSSFASTKARLTMIVTVIALLPLSTSLGTAQVKSDEKEKWKKTLAAGRNEGKVTIYFSSGPQGAVEAFRKEHPELKVTWVSDRGDNLMNRIMAERRAGKYIPDVITTGASTYNVLYRAQALVPIKPTFMLPEIKDQSAWWGEKHRYIDSEERFVFVYGGWPIWPVYYNAAVVGPGEIKSYWDILNPKWKGKILSFDPTLATISAPLQFFYYHPHLGPEFMKRFFGGMDMTFSRDLRQLVDWLAVGKSAFCFACRGARRAKQQGLPIDELTGLKEGAYLAMGGATLALPDRAPHPNAAKVFINWFLSRKGQLAYQKLGDPNDTPNSLRTDISKDDVPLEKRLVRGESYFDVNRPELSDLTPILSLTKNILRDVQQKR